MKRFPTKSVLVGVILALFIIMYFMLKYIIHLEHQRDIYKAKSEETVVSEAPVASTQSCATWWFGSANLKEARKELCSAVKAKRL